MELVVMNKDDLAKLPKTGWPNPVAGIGAKFYAAKPEKYLAPKLLPDATRQHVSKLGGTAVQPKAKR
jgi:hypothetical protein